jgi:2,4-dienoyl-CoA reductase-like NADH-dependent reductase (Old Yellow Enzyme family)
MPGIFETNSLSGVVLQNRIIRSATVEAMAGPDGSPGELLTDLYKRLAQGGTGALITGLTGIMENGRAYPGMLMLHNDGLIESYKRMLDSVKRYDMPVFAQLGHGGGKIHPSILKSRPVAPSRMMYPPYSVMARPVTEAEIREIIENCVNAAERARKAGFDGIQLHGAHGYLFSEFLSPRCNRRSDDWGGDTAGRFKIIGEIMRGIRQTLGTYPILIKISGEDSDKNGMTLREAVSIAKMFTEAGGDAVEVSCGTLNPFDFMRVKTLPLDAAVQLDTYFYTKPKAIQKILKTFMPLMLKTPPLLENYNAGAAGEIKKKINIPVITVGGLRRRSEMERLLQAGTADYLALSRPLIMEPDLPAKFRDGRQSESRCIDCGYCAVGLTAAPLRCYYGKVPKSL